MNIGAIVQARLSSSRLPAKVLLPLAGKPVLWHVLNRLKHSKRLHTIVLATSTLPEDKKLKEVADEFGIPTFFGSLDDVLSRYYHASRQYKIDPVIRITADCPMIDPEIVDEVIEHFLEQPYDYYSLYGNFPDGLDTEIIKFDALRTAFEEAKLPSEREHIGEFFKSNRDRFRTGVFEKFSDKSNYRWTLDEPEDNEFLKKVFGELYTEGEVFSYRDVFELLEKRPELLEINSHIIRNEGYQKSLQEDKKFLTEIEKEMTGPSLYKKAVKIIPGGTQLYSKRPELFLPELWPTYYSKAKGVEVVDLDGNRYIDMCIFAVGACVLGYADEDVDRAVKQAIDNGSTSTLNCPEEVELAQLLCHLHPWADMVRFSRSGGEAVAIAIRIARAHSGKDKIAFCGYHGWCDWYLAANLGDSNALDGQLMPGLPPSGVPRSLKDTALPFAYGDFDGLEKIVKKHGDELAAIIMEPARDLPDKGFLEYVRKTASSTGTLLIFDEITSGFRINTGGIHLTLDVNPDIAVFAKAMGNGYPIAAVIGTKEAMQAAQSTFISSTNWSERTGFAAAIATIKKFEQENVAEHLMKVGQRIQSGWHNAAEKNGLNIKVSGIFPLSHFSFEYDNSLAISTFFTQEMLKKGFLGWVQFKASYAHKDSHVNSYLIAVDEVFRLIKDALDANRVEKLLESSPAQKGFYRLVKN
ncbi:MAG: aminotransferase class III-fold pyridoxal phosphate-dependent enzyme [Planctomycetes bacterium]|nr:aminotransferase class III-fold pyridoxal phosphate-dependent enzyme [Planctomycetota bacterium]